MTPDARFASWRHCSWRHDCQEAFHDSNLGPPQRHAICLTGQVRTFTETRPSLERALLASNSVDLFFHVFLPGGQPWHDSDADADARCIARSVLTLPHRAVTVERWSSAIVEQMHRDRPALRLCGECAHQHGLPRSKCPTTSWTQNGSSKRTLAARCETALDDARSTGGSGVPLHAVSQWRKRALCWDMMLRHSAAHSHTYAAVVSTRLDLHYPPQPLSLDLVSARSSELNAVLVPAGADLPNFNDQLAMGNAAAMRPYLQAYQQCGAETLTNGDGRRPQVLHSAAPSAAQQSWALLESCADNLTLTVLARSTVSLRRFWYQYWIVRQDHLLYYAANRETFHKGFYSIACWQRLVWRYPARRVNAKTFVHLNTSCTCDPGSLDGVETGFSWREQDAHATLEELRQFCNYEGDRCNKCEYPSLCRTDRGKPPGEQSAQFCPGAIARRSKFNLFGPAKYAPVAPARHAPALPKVNHAPSTPKRYAPVAPVPVPRKEDNASERRRGAGMTWCENRGSASTCHADHRRPRPG